ncbi:MAG: molybdenum ABC transporter ATP-binding protein [Candidatus Binatia bacterium]
MIEVDVQHRLGRRFQLTAHFASEGALTALFGRSGAGKSTLVNIIGGLIRPERGRVVVEGRTLVDTERGIFVPKHRRRAGYVFQEGRLFPHLTVRHNLLYGRWFAPPAERQASFEHVVELLGIEHLLERRPVRLSGGEKQRVAVGRALLSSPRFLLMDEPLASLDEARKADILPYIERLRDETKIPIVYVSHMISEVARLATTLVVLSEGKVVAAGPTLEIMSRLDLITVTGRREAGAVLQSEVIAHDEEFALTTLRSPAGDLRVPILDLPIGAPIRVRVRARDVMIGIRPPQGLSALNVLEGVLAEVGPQNGPIVEVRIDCHGEALLARVTRRSFEQLALAPGLRVFAVIKSVALDRRTLGVPVHGFDIADAETNGE